MKKLILCALISLVHNRLYTMEDDSNKALSTIEYLKKKEELTQENKAKKKELLACYETLVNTSDSLIKKLETDYNDLKKEHDDLQGIMRQLLNGEITIDDFKMQNENWQQLFKK